MWVQIAENATTSPWVGWDTMIGLPLASWAEMAPPTGTSETLASTSPPAAPLPPDPEAVVGAEEEPPPPPPHAASTDAPSAVPAPATRTLRRENPSRQSCVS